MSHIIELEVLTDLKQTYFQQSNARWRAASTKIKRALSQYFSSNIKNSRVYVNKNANSFEGYAEMLPFYYVYSFGTKVQFKENQKHLKLKSIPLCQGKPFTIPMKNLRIAGIHLLLKHHNLFPGLILSLDLNSGQIHIKNSVVYSEQLIKKEYLLREIINKMTDAISRNTDNFIKLFRQMSNQFQVNKKSSSHIPLSHNNSKILQSVRKYLKLSFIDIQFSDTGIFRHRNNNQISLANIFNNHASINLEQYSISNTLSLFQIFHVDKNQSLQNIMLPCLQVQDLFNLLKFPTPKINTLSDNQYIFNEIKIINPQKVQLINSSLRGGTAELWFAKLQFQYQFFQQKDADQKFNPCIQGLKLEKPVLVKVPLDKNSAKYIQHEISILKTFGNSNSAYLIKYYQTDDKFSNLKGKLIMDYASSCMDLEKFLQRNRQTTSIITKFMILGNIANGLRFLKNQKIVHMDLTPKNILIGQAYLTKIIDFGQAYCQRVCGHNYKPGFTNPYGPPQVFTQKHFSIKQDIFSFGIILYKIITGQFPYNPTQELKKSYKNKTYNKKLFFAAESLQYIWLSQPMLLIFSLFVRCKTTNPFYRPDPAWIRVILKLLSEWYKRQIFDH